MAKEVLETDSVREGGRRLRLQLPELAELAQALTSLGVEQPELYRAISDAATKCLEDGKAQPLRS